MKNVWSKKPRSYQLRAMATLLKLHCLDQRPRSLLLVQGTGRGKLTVPQTVGVVTCGVTLVIEHMLSLGADQSSKFKNARQHNGSVTAYQLDAIVNGDDVKTLTNTLVSLLPDTNLSIFLYSSPERLLILKWSDLIDQLIFKKN